MGIFNWFKKSKAQDNSQATTIQLNDDYLNKGTYVTTQDLIQLQAQARKLDLSQRTFARASTTGSHHSRFRGRGMDYQESRIYQAGDDIRNMDWRVTARSGKPHTKLYQEERERPVILLVDFNPSMFFGSKNVFKSVLASQTAALLGWAAAFRGDRVGSLIIGLSNRKGQQLAHKELPPKMGKRGALQLIRELVKHSNPAIVLQSIYNQTSDSAHSDSSNLNQELKRLRRISKPGSLLFIISDFYGINEETGNHLLRLSHHADIMAIQIIDPLEVEAPVAGLYGVTDGESAGVMNTRSKKEVENYNRYFAEHHKKVAQLMLKRKIPLLRLSTTDNPAKVLQQRFGEKGQRLSMLSSSLVSSQKAEKIQSGSLV